MTVEVQQVSPRVTGVLESLDAVIVRFQKKINTKFVPALVELRVFVIGADGYTDTCAGDFQWRNIVTATSIKRHLTVGRLKFALDMTDSRVVDDDVSVKWFLRQAALSNANAEGNI